MKKLTSYQIGIRTIIIIALLNLVLPLSAQIDSVENLPQYLYPNFAKSVVKLKTGESFSALLNYNTVTEKMIFYQNGSLMTLTKPETIDTVFLQNSKFVFYENVFYEVLPGTPVSLFIQHRSDLVSPGKPAAYGTPSETAGSTSISKLYNDKAYNLKLPESYKVTPAPAYWIRKNNLMQKFSSERQFIKLFPSKAEDIKKYIDKEKISIKNQNDLIKLVTFCNELTR